MNFLSLTDLASLQILYFYQYFSTPAGGWGTRVYEFTREWVAQGHEVTVVTSIYAKSDLQATRLIEDQLIDGIRVKVLNIRIDNRQSLGRRIWSFIQYTVLSSWYALRLPADVVIASSGPITAGIPGLVAHYLRGKPLVFEVRDLWPEGAIQLGVIKNRIIQRLAYALEGICYRAACQIVTLSPGMQRNIEQRFGYTKVHSITNAANLELFGTPQPFSHPLLQPPKYAIYTGNIGTVNHSLWLLEAAKILRDRGRTDLKIVLIGEGQQKDIVRERAEKEGVTNLLLLDLMPKTQLVAFVQHALVSLIPLKGIPVLDTSSPNKFFESLAAGVPVLQTTQGWMKDFLAEHHIGFTLDPDDPAALAQQLIHLDADPAQAAAMGSHAHTIARQYFDKDYLAAKMLAVIHQCSKAK